MQRLARLLSTNLAVLGILSSIMLGLGQQDPKLPLMVIIAALASVAYTDRRKLFHLNHHVANLAALCAVGLALFDFSASDRNQQLLAIANLLVYLQVVVFFQEKNSRIFGQLAMLSLLQVVVAAALNYSILFGFLIVAYMAIGLPTLSLFFFYRELSRFVSPEQPSRGESSAGERILAAPLDRAVLSSLRSESSDTPKETARNRWPLSSQHPTFSGEDFQQREEAFGKGGLLAFTARMTIFTLLLTILIFIFAPRINQSPWQTASLQPTRIVGYSEEVKLGEMGGALENPETVMTVKLVDERERTIRLTGTPLFRGTVLTRYQLAPLNRWGQEGRTSNPSVEDLKGIRPGMRNLVRQEITMEALDDSTVFAIQPVFAPSGIGSPIKFDDNRHQLFRPELHKDQKYRFELYTNGIKDNRQNPIIPAREGIFGYEGLSGYEIDRMLRIPRGESEIDPFAGLKRVADEAVEASGAPPDDPYLVAQALERFLLTQGRFRYSLEGQEIPDRSVDPIEDFVTRSRTGHCEYFASALTLMLRHRGIPARMVLGFKGGDWNSIGQWYQVRQLHAHAWVEAYIKREDMQKHSDELRASDRAAWVTLDPTADTLASQRQGTESLWQQARSVVEYVEMQWISYVVGFNREQQKQAVYQPITDVYQRMKQRFEPTRKNLAVDEPWYLRVYHFLKDSAGGEWFSWRGLWVSIGLLLTLSIASSAIYYLSRILWTQALKYWRNKNQGAEELNRAQIAFYRQLEMLLARYGFHRRPGETQLEFANATSRKLAANRPTEEVSPLPRAVVNAFYAVRFGGRDLDRQQTEEVEQALADLRTALAVRDEHSPAANASASSSPNTSSSATTHGSSVNGSASNGSTLNGTSGKGLNGSRHA